MKRELPLRPPLLVVGLSFQLPPPAPILHPSPFLICFLSPATKDVVTLSDFITPSSSSYPPPSFFLLLGSGPEGVNDLWYHTGRVSLSVSPFLAFLVSLFHRFPDPLSHTYRPDPLAWYPDPPAVFPESLVGLPDPQLASKTLSLVCTHAGLSS